MADQLTPGTIRSSRHFPWPQEVVFGAFRDPELLARWWGPEGFSNEIHEFDLRPGGAFHLTMRGPDGGTYDNRKRFTAVEPPSRIEFHHLQPIHDFTMEMRWTPEDNGTRLDWRMTFADPAEAEKLRGFIGPANEQNFDRLEAVLRQNPTTP